MRKDGDIMKLDRNKMILAIARKAVSIRDLAKLSGLSESAIASFKSGRREPTPKSIGKLAIALDVDVTELLVDEDTKKE